MNADEHGWEEEVINRKVAEGAEGAQRKMDFGFEEVINHERHENSRIGREEKDGLAQRRKGAKEVVRVLQRFRRFSGLGNFGFWEEEN